MTSESGIAPQFAKLRIPKIHKNYGMKVEAKVFYEGPSDDRTDDVNWLEHVPSLLPASTRQRFDGAALQIFKKIQTGETFNNVPTYKTSFIKVQSPVILQQLKTVLEGSDINFGKTSVVIYSPFQHLFFAWDAIEGICSNAVSTLDPEERAHVTLLWNFMTSELHEKFDRARKLAWEGWISFDLIWTLFPQGATVFSSTGGYQQVYRVLSCEMTNKEDHEPGHCNIRCEFVEFDGYEYGHSQITFEIHEFPDTKPIVMLQVYPWAYVDDAKALKDKLIRRGRSVLDFQEFAFRFYDGIAFDREVYDRIAFDRDPDWTMSKFNVVGRVVIDPYLCARTNANFQRKIRPLHKRGNEDAMAHRRFKKASLREDREKEFRLKAPTQIPRRPDIQQQNENRKIVANDEENLLLMSPLLDGFSFTEKKWRSFLVDHVRPLELNLHAFEELVLPYEHKSLILAFARQRHEKVHEVDDIIAGKGHGLMVLLSGPPGTGKTLTAEAVADKVGRPLYHVDTHELGASSQDLSLKLRHIMNIAAEWNAIVLLDEADVFLQKRTTFNFYSNEYVAVFLRELEYYRGTMFLTTNLLENFDEAVESRLHVHIIFKTLLAPALSKIWTNFLSKLPDSTNLITEAEIRDLATWCMNGRQIKNSVQMAVTWCSREGKPLDMTTMENIIRLTCPRVAKGKDKLVNGDT